MVAFHLPVEQPMKNELPRVRGALVAYTVTEAEVEQRAASFINRILRDAKPGDLPSNSRPNLISSSI
jgi:hypothetical protein